MRFTSLLALAAAGLFLASSLPADAQTRRGQRVEREGYPGEYVVRGRRARARITVTRRVSRLGLTGAIQPGSRSYTDYSLPPLDYPSRIWDTTGSHRSPLFSPFDGSGWYFN